MDDNLGDTGKWRNHETCLTALLLATGGSSTAETVAGGARRRFTAPAGEPVVLPLRNLSRF
jgi:hypothetical protein